MKRLLTAAALLALAAGPALAQSTTAGGTGGEPVVPPADAPVSPDQMGNAATTGDITDTTGVPGGPMMGTDSLSTGSTVGDGTLGGRAPIGEPGLGSAGTLGTPTGGAVPGQTAN